MVHPLLIEVVGIVATLSSFTLFLPNARETWGLRHDYAKLARIPIITQVFIIVNAALWLLYGHVTGAHWSGISGLLNGPLGIATIMLVVHAQHLAGVAKHRRNLGFDHRHTAGGNADGPDAGGGGYYDASRPADASTLLGEVAQLRAENARLRAQLAQ